MTTRRRSSTRGASIVPAAATIAAQPECARKLNAVRISSSYVRRRVSSGTRCRSLVIAVISLKYGQHHHTALGRRGENETAPAGSQVRQVHGRRGARDPEVRGERGTPPPAQARPIRLEYARRGARDPEVRVERGTPPPAQSRRIHPPSHRPPWRRGPRAPPAWRGAGPPPPLPSVVYDTTC